MKTNILSSKVSFIVAISIFMLQPSIVIAQEEQLAEILEQLETQAGGTVEGVVRPGAENGYKSFVQNELQNIFTQLDALSEQDKVDITFAEVNKKISPETLVDEST